MGMSSSQARLLSITARMNDVEFKSQTISNTKLRLADESEAVSRAYTDTLNKSKLTYTDWSSGHAAVVDLNISNLSTYGYRLTKINGQPLTDKEIKDMSTSSYDLYEMIESGQFYLQKQDAETSEWKETSVSGDNLLGIGAVDSAALAKAEADYNAATSRINRKEKLLDNELKALDTEHNALKTEQDAIKSLISDNVSKTFNIFS